MKLFIIFILSVFTSISANFCLQKNDCESCIKMQNCSYFIKNGNGSCSTSNTKISGVQFKAKITRQCATANLLTGKQNRLNETGNEKQVPTVKPTFLSSSPSSTLSSLSSFSGELESDNKVISSRSEKEKIFEGNVIIFNQTRANQLNYSKEDDAPAAPEKLNETHVCNFLSFHKLFH